MMQSLPAYGDGQRYTAEVTGWGQYCEVVVKTISQNVLLNQKPQIEEI